MTIRQRKFLKKRSLEFKKEVKIQDAFISDFDRSHGVAIFKEHKIVVHDNQKLLSDAEIIDFAIQIYNNLSPNYSKIEKSRNISISQSFNPLTQFTIVNVSSLEKNLPEQTI